MKEYQTSRLELAQTAGAKRAVSVALTSWPRDWIGKGPAPGRMVGLMHRSLTGAGHGLVIQVVPMPAKVNPAQPLGPVTEHTKVVVLQQAPEGQTVAAQVAPATPSVPLQVPPVVATRVQAAVLASQQGVAQRLGEQTPAAVKTPVQTAWKPTEQVVPTQQLPVAGQAVAPQMALSPW